MAFDFPASPSENQIYAPTGGPIYIFKSGVWRASASELYLPTAERLNRIVNPNMAVSQQWGDTLVGVTGYYAADQWAYYMSTTGHAQFQRVQVPTPNGSRDRIRVNCFTADTSLAATEYLHISQAIEGNVVADFGWGAAGARQVVLRFGFRGPAGTYTASIRNGSRAYLAPFTISAGQANIDTEQVLVIPGDVTGTWVTDGTRGMFVTICLAAGAGAFYGSAGWNAGGQIAITGQFNGFGTVGNLFDLFDVGLYRDPNNTGLPPPWEPPDYQTEWDKCLRYYQSLYNVGSMYQPSAGSNCYSHAAYMVPMRGAVIATGTSSNNANCSTAMTLAETQSGVRELRTASAAGNVFYSTTLICNARM